MSENPYLSVYTLTKYIKRKFEADPYLRNVLVKGELSNVKIHPSGHIYFTLKDDKSRIQSAMFRSAANSLKFKPEEGMNVLITGDVNVFEASGQYQLYVQTMQPDGVGALYLAYEQLKKELAKEGLFDARWKQRLPLLPRKIGVITAQSGAAIRDICSTIQRRYPLAEICLFPAIVQGPQAAPSIVDAISLAESNGSIDVLIIGRGGGSIEDLWAFNEESVARAIFSCRIPIISAVGHETDTTIADFVADMRAPTPTAAAELAVPSREELFERILERKRSIYKSFSHQIKQERKRLTTYQQSYPLQFPERLYRPFTEKLGGLDDRLLRSKNDITVNRKANHERLERMLSFYSPIQRIKEESRNIDLFSERLTRTMQIEMQKNSNKFNSIIRMLKALNPLDVMDRGFSIVYKEGNVVNSIENLEVGGTVQVRMQDGTLEADIKSIMLKYKEDNLNEQ
ncbi:exodeoxyribonuclease VII large subunit [Sporosarcina highlanderae]|uniref:Exodeoxyribonuclease 7 large subunit n=1 Tax=Sporosarcina highlanderae TaxID=3035916 RepID=A0ABT8JRK3_9BACL|nr:exodeoxyribonuclease VII large subunit [Sporosarcina highlanderae]MDN4607779.1 exodeoxyribonuclease VII large subunit [Sporosarcina highlanderae]